MSFRSVSFSTARFIVVGAAISIFAVPAGAQDRANPPTASTSAHQMTTAAVDFLESLSAAQREAVSYAFSEENRTNWSNTPIFVHDRPGLRFSDLSDGQRQAAHRLLRASLSSQGYQKVTGIMRLDRVHGDRELARLEREGPAEGERPYYQEQAESFGSGSYAVAIFGNPGRDADWGWVIQGHHMGASFTVSEGQTGFTPLFLGATPLVLERGIYAGWSALSHEVSRGVELMQSLTDEQQSVAVVADEVPNDVIEGVGRRNSVAEQTGLRASDMTPAQRRLLRVLVEEYVRNSDFDAAEAQLESISESGWENLSFAWHGPADDQAAPFYYRVHGDRILIELTRRPNHIHTIVRDPANDYGESWLDQAYTEEYSANDRFDMAVTAYEAENE